MMHTLQTIAAIWAAGFILIQVVGRVSLRKEPTAHGVIEGYVAMWLVSLFWPIFLLWVVLAGALFGLSWLFAIVARTTEPKQGGE